MKSGARAGARGPAGRGQTRPKPSRPYRTYARPAEDRKPGRAALAVRVGIGLVAALGIYFALFFETGSDDEQVRRRLEEGRLQFMERDLGGFMDLISDDYKDRHGYTKIAIQGLMGRIFLYSSQSPQSRSPEVELSRIEVERVGEEAVVTLEARVSVLGPEDRPVVLLGRDGPRPITIHCRKEKGAAGTRGSWRVVFSTGWQNADATI